MKRKEIIQRLANELKILLKLTSKSYFFLALIFFVITQSCNRQQAVSQENNFQGWKHFSIDPILPGSYVGGAGPVLADFDRDGVLDVVVSRRITEQAYWYKRINDSIWIPHYMEQSDNLKTALASAGPDVDQDGFIDVVFPGVWFRNPGNLSKSPDTRWETFPFPGKGHDIVAVDIDGDGHEDIVAYDGKKLAWYNTSDSLRENIISIGHDDHGGTAPHGFGDLDGDGDIDLVIPGFWFENPANGIGKWEKHEWPFVSVPNASYGRSIRAWIVDINNDGRNDIVYGNCDTGGSHVYWVENKDTGMTWESHQLPDPPTIKGDVPGTGSFHSLGVTDFNLDGFLDIFAGEQEDPSTNMERNGKVAMKPRGLKERGVIWYNGGGEILQFKTYIIHIDNPGWHDAQLGDVDGDGDIDIVTKNWKTDSIVYHLDYWRNELKK